MLLHKSKQQYSRSQVAAFSMSELVVGEVLARGATGVVNVAQLNAVPVALKIFSSLCIDTFWAEVAMMAYVMPRD
jgi:hypothetical protein